MFTRLILIKLLEYHINQKADITVGYTKLAEGQDDPTRFGVMQMDTDGRVLGFEEKAGCYR